jgi:pilus assembly protein CpaE
MAEQDTVVVQIETIGRVLREDLKGIAASVEGFSIADANYSGTCDLLILEIGEDVPQEFQLINRMRASGFTGEIFLTSRSMDPAVLINAMRLGVREFFPQPLREEDVKGALLKFRKRSKPASVEDTPVRKGQIIAVLGAKGGVGTTTLAVNLATGLSSGDGHPSVALVDSNVLFGEVPLFLNMKPVSNSLDVSKNIERLDATYLMSILIKHPSGVHVLPSPGRLVGDEEVLFDAMERLLALMKTMFDFVVIDSGQYLDDSSKTILRDCDRAVLVTTLSLPGLVNLKRLLDAMRTLGCASDDRVEIVANRYSPKSGISVEEAEESLGRRIRWTIPNDYRNTMDAINSGVPLTAMAKGADVTKRLLEMASAFANQEAEPRKEKRRSLFGLIQL